MWRSVCSHLLRVELLVEPSGKLLGRWERASIESNCFILCLTICSAINSFNSYPQLGDISLLVQGINKISQFLPFVSVDTVLDVIIQSWQFKRGGVSFMDAISFCHHIQYFCWYRFLVESIGMWSRTEQKIFSYIWQSVRRKRFLRAASTSYLYLSQLALLT